MRAPKWEGGGEGVRKRKWGGNLFGSIYSLNCLVFISIVEGEFMPWCVLKIDLQFYLFYYSTNVLNLYVFIYIYISYKIYFLSSHSPAIMSRNFDYIKF